MTCKLDENLGAATHRRLADAGHDVSTVVLQRMAGAPDSAVFERCATEGRVLVTCDLDFANPFVFDPRPTAGVVVLRLPKAMTKQHQARGIVSMARRRRHAAPGVVRRPR